LTGRRLATGRRRAFLLILLAALLTGLAASPAPATTLKQRLKVVEAKLNVLYTQSSVAVERYDQAVSRLQAVDARITANRRLLAETQVKLVTAQNDLANQVVASYKQPQADVIGLLFNTHSFDELVTQLDAIQRISAERSQVVDSVQAAKKRIVNLQIQLTADRAATKKLVADAAQQKAAIESLVSKQEQLVKGLKKQILAQERAAALAAKRAAEAARRAARLAAQRAAQAALAQRTGSGGYTGGVPIVNPGGPGHPEVVAIAQRYLGVPYVWGGASPSGFDCSGLVMYVYAQIGISLPHGATAQQSMSTPVPLSALQAGDLVFFGGPSFSHHVGIYVGGGIMINAPHTGAVVSYASIASFGDAWIGGRF
jgi:cell wall-associated NlpC family hydrolase